MEDWEWKRWCGQSMWIRTCCRDCVKYGGTATGRSLIGRWKAFWTFCSHAELAESRAACAQQEPTCASDGCESSVRMGASGACRNLTRGPPLATQAQSGQAPQQLPHHKVKIKKPGQRACNEKDAKGKLCGGHLKRWYYVDDIMEREHDGDVE